MKKLFLLSVLALCLSACTSFPMITQLPQQQVASETFKVERRQNQTLYQTSLLTVQFMPNQWRWVQTELLGSPLARLLLTPQGWQNDGFVMPNSQAQWLFLALAYEFSPPLRADLIEVQQTSQNKIYRRRGEWLWTTRALTEQWEIVLADGSEWHIERLN